MKHGQLAFGAMRLPQTSQGEIDYAPAKEMVDLALKEGLNYFDTAYFYHDGKSEGFLAKALAEYPRNSYILADKLPVHLVKSKLDAHRIFDEQLERCNTDYFDMYLMHALNGERFQAMEELGICDVLMQKKAKGQIRRLGFSFHDSPEVLAQICDSYQWDFVQIQLNYYDWTSYRSEEQYQVLRKRNIPCLVMEPVRGGRLADLGPEANGILKQADPEGSIASWALRFAALLPGVERVLSGMSTLEQVQDNLKIFKDMQPFTPEQETALAEATRVFRKNLTITCTGCSYCMPCPEGVNIPDLFTLYNMQAREDMKEFTQWYDDRDDKDKADKCIACGKCADLCPQKLPIPEYMGQIHRKVPPQEFTV